VCSAQIRKMATTIQDNGIFPWSVYANKPFSDASNLNQLTTNLDISAQCQLCHYSEGAVGDVVDLSQTPEQAGYRPRMYIYLQLKPTAASSPKAGGGRAAQLTEAELRLLRKLKRVMVPEMLPDDECVLCSRTQAGDGQDGPGVAGGGQDMMAGFMPHSPGQPAPIGPAVVMCEVGVQCGNAASFGDSAPITHLVGSAARMHHHAGFNADPRDFKNAASTAGFRDFDSAVTDLKTQLETALREREQFCVEKRNETNLRLDAERWRRDHKCEVSAEFAKLRGQNDMLHTALRDLMRGREEVFGMLQQRRTAGSVLADTPMPYSALNFSVPSLEQTPSAKQLIGHLGGSPTPGRQHGGGGGYDGQSPAGPHDNSAIDVHLMPSGRKPASPPGGGRQAEPAHTERQPNGQCLLRVASISGDPFHVKRKVASQIRPGGQHVLMLRSLDGVVTDEIHVDDLQAVSVDGATGMHLSTTQHSWHIYLNAAERQQWVHWLYALNPFLSAQKNAHTDPIPNNL
jgi:hypothetical protein